MLFQLCLSFVLLFASTAYSEATAKSYGFEPAPVPGDSAVTSPRVIAHRGAWKEFGLPDNSIAALKKAIEIQCDGSECDIQLTKDKKVLVYHDGSIDGVPIKDLTHSEISNIRLENGEPIPLLEDFIDLIKAEDFILWIDVKSLSEEAGGNAWSIEAAKQAAKLVREKKAEEHIMFISARKAVHDKCILFARGAWDCGYMNTKYSPEEFVSSGYTWVNFTYTKFFDGSSDTNLPLFKVYLEKNLKLSVYTVNKEEAMEWFLSRDGLYAITTNLPFKLLQKKISVNKKLSGTISAAY